MKSITLSPAALEQLDEWKKSDPKILVKIISLITEISSTPFTGTGKPELLKHDLKGKWSRRITQEHRLVYEVTDTTIIIISCRFHYF
ncbi:MAG TPA: Txe/YoeB family addiction module toxin [Hanamia sp.]|jgi:toxin-antitoxin system, toxin component, Txe/YoeB family|nr:Txe/YoeB family addiction module toxin [Hanamia sp.]